MKSFLLLVLFLLMLAIAIPYCYAKTAVGEMRAKAQRPGKGMDRAALLLALRMKETGNRPGAVGRLNERTAYQFTAQTWKIYTSAPFATAGIDTLHADRVADAHLAYITRQLDRRGLPIEPAFIAAAWRYGPWFKLDCVRSDYAREVANLYEVYAARP